MNFERFIAKKISEDGSDNYAKPVIKISYISIALGLALMIISVAIVIGFKSSVSNKIIGFASHIQIVPFDNNDSFEERPLKLTNTLVDELRNNPVVKHFQYSARKAGVIKTEDQIQGIILKGVGPDFDKRFLLENLVDGHFPAIGADEKTDEVLISKLLADKLNLKVGDDLRTWFVIGDKGQARGRKFMISGLYKTSLEEFDNIYIIGDIQQIQRLNNWEEGEVGSIEIMISEPDKIRDVAFDLYKSIPFDMRVVTVMDEYPQIFNWLDLLDMNVIVILTLLILVASITMISTLLVLIIERTNMVGVLKAMGASNGSIRKIFLYKASYIIFRGMFWGNLIGLGFFFLQYYFQPIKLSASDYYVDYVPVELSIWSFVLLNSGTFIVCLMMLIAPSYYISRIIPASALRYQ